MTRGQNTLTIDLHGEDQGDNAANQLPALPLGDILVVRASHNELAAHEMVLNALDKEVRGNCVWRLPSAER
jgi:DNA polymerase-3 subunit epsilon